MRSLLEHLYELVAESSEKRTNLRLMRDLQLVNNLLHILSDVRQNSTRHVLLALLSILLGQPRQADLLWYTFYFTTLKLIVDGLTFLIFYHDLFQKVRSIYRRHFATDLRKAFSTERKRWE